MTIEELKRAISQAFDNGVDEMALAYSYAGTSAGAKELTEEQALRLGDALGCVRFEDGWWKAHSGKGVGKALREIVGPLTVEQAVDAVMVGVDAGAAQFGN